MILYSIFSVRGRYRQARQAHKRKLNAFQRGGLQCRPGNCRRIPRRCFSRRPYRFANFDHSGLYIEGTVGCVSVLVSICINLWFRLQSMFFNPLLRVCPKSHDFKAAWLLTNNTAIEFFLVSFWREKQGAVQKLDDLCNMSILRQGIEALPNK